PSPLIRPPPTSALFPYTTLFRSGLIDRVVVRKCPRCKSPHYAARSTRRRPCRLERHRAFIPALRHQYPEPGPFLRRLVEIQGGKDRKSTRLNSSHVKISYAVFCL